MAAKIDVQQIEKAYAKITDELKKIINGQEEVIEQTVLALFAGGHILLEGVPGLGKTLLARSLGDVISGPFKRIQFTPDLMPSDIIGTTVYSMEDKKFLLKKGPIFTSVLLADEINRSPGKTQAALLQAMQEREVTIDGQTIVLDNSFICLATQNPIEMEGTFPLPEAQVDRFFMKIYIDYPEYSAEKEMLSDYRECYSIDKLDEIKIKSVITSKALQKIKTSLSEITVDDKIVEYIMKIVTSTRNFPGIAFGASPRGGVSLLLAARAKAAISGRSFVIPDDVKSIYLPILRHRIILDAEAEIEGFSEDDYLKKIIAEVKVPR